LRERAVGVYEGLAHDAPRKPRPPHVPPRKHRVEGGESWDDVNRRARKLLARLGSTFVATKDDSRDRLRVLCVTHGGFIMEVIYPRLAISAPRSSERPKLGHDPPLIQSTVSREEHLTQTTTHLELKHNLNFDVHAGDERSNRS